MDNQLSSIESMSASDISVLANVKEVHGESKNYTHVFLLIIMVVFAVFVVGLSVYNFQGNVQPEIKVIHAEVSHSDDLQKLTNQ